MIRGEELQLGDYVLIEGKPRQVESITKKKVGYHKDKQNDKRLYYARLREIEPVEITREILINSGFVECKGVPYYAYINEDRDARLFRYPLSWNTANVVAGAINKDIYYLHQYQQTCRLDGIKIDWKV